MLSGESAGGQYPLESVDIMARTSTEAENTLNHKQLFENTKAATV
jgi:pyruvate kinase